jgi:ribosomal protein S18 acetylase RimI-like enzyme
MRLRAVTAADLEAVLAVISARDIADLGAPDFTLEDLREEWSDTETVLAELDGRIAGYATAGAHRSSGAVDPACEGRGVGAALLDWVQDRERKRGLTRHRHAVAASDVRGRGLLESRGYTLERIYHRMTATLPVAAAAVPAVDAALRELAPDDARVVHAISEAAFAAVTSSEPESFDAFCAEHLEAHDHDPSLSRVAMVDRATAGFALARRREAESAGYLDLLAVEPDWQGRGIAAALLTDAFAAFWAAGLRAAELGVASDNPRALRLYERLGMTVRFSTVTYIKPVRR